MAGAGRSFNISDADGSVLIFCDGTALWISTNSGSTWTAAGSFPVPYAAEVPYCGCCSSTGATIIIGTNGGGLYRSVNTGATWTELTPNASHANIWNFVKCDSDASVILAGIYNGDLYLTVNSATSWDAFSLYTATVPATYYNWSCADMSDDGQVMLVGDTAGYPEYTPTGRLFLSLDTGDTWTEQRPAGNADCAWKDCSVSGDGTIYIAGVYNGRLYTNASPTVIYQLSIDEYIVTGITGGMEGSIEVEAAPVATITDITHTIPDPDLPYMVPLFAGQLIEVYKSCLYLARDNILYISQPLRDHIDSRSGYRVFNSRITLLRAVDGGIYVSDDKVYFLSGDTPGELIRREVHPFRAIPFTDVLTDEREIIWTSEDGICKGDHGGKVISLTSDRYKLTGQGRGAGFIRDIGNVKHYVNSLY
jgi:hypothetical protein